MKPTVGVAIPAYMHAEFIGTTIESVLRQTLQADIIVVVDDRSDDDTASIAEQFDRVRVIRHSERQGPTRTTADAIAECRTDFVAVLDGDDLMRRQRLEVQVRALLEDDRIAIVGSLVQPIDPHDRPIGGPTGTPGVHAALDWVKGGMLAGGSSLMVRAPFVNHDLGLTWASDWKFVLDNLEGQAASLILDEVLVDYRRHPGSVSTLHRVNGLTDHVLMCDALIDSTESTEMLAALREQRAAKRCQLGEAQLSERQYRAAARSLVGATIDSRGALVRSVTASVRDGLRARR